LCQTPIKRNVTLGLYRFNDLEVLKTAPMPAALLETGIIVNRREEQERRPLP